ncbi:polyprenol monophosphomannose synthase [Pseudobdellovibrio sp. HCB154]|uniref:polyprenol monophosphomannose synthase n=1 Tax=Pseudobdellovibrio sp. HCB154 TaxID=3386277 RepID=UPI0039175D2E
MRKLVIIPTYNEIENMKALLPVLMKLKQQFDVLVVDDSSPDGTAKFVEEFAKTEPRVHVLVRAAKQGLGKAYLAGFDWGLKKGYDVLTEMDADFSHAPSHLDEILALIDSHDVVIGSRYVKGGGTVNWGILRKIISRGGSLYSRIILGYPLRDWTGGFNCWRKEVLEKINLSGIRSNGYSFQIELKYKALKNGYKIHEAPIIFEDRRVGQSKMSLKIVLEAFYKVWLIKSY